MLDNYSHIDNSIIYIYENIPGPVEESEQYENLILDYNSQLSRYCQCDKCGGDSDFCTCHKISGGVNYNLTKETCKSSYILNSAKNLNNGIIIECNAFCKCKQDCGNRVVQNGPIDCLKIKLCSNKLKGFGLFTHNFIVKGSFICEYAGEIITNTQAIYRHYSNKLAGRMNYIFCLNEHANNTTIQTFIDPTYFGNIGRYINHSCKPNCEIIPVRVNSPVPKLAVFSSADIFPGSEITFDYGSNYLNANISDVQDGKPCLCNSMFCRGLIPFEDFS